MIPAPLVRKFSWRVFGMVFAGVMATALLYTAIGPRLYQSAVRVQFDRPAAQLSALPNFDYETPLNFGEVSAGAASKAITHEVAERLVKSDDVQAFLKPYGYSPDTGAAVIEKILRRNLQVVVHPESQIIEIIYRHPDPEVAAKLAKQLGYGSGFQGNRRRIDSQMRAMEYEYRHTELQRALVQADVSLLELYGDVRTDLSARLKNDQTILDALTKHLEQLAQSNGGISGRDFEVHAPPTSADRYPIHPLIRNLAWGLICAAMIGTGAGLIFKRSTEDEAPSQGTTRMLRANLMLPIRSRDMIVFGLVFLTVSTLAVYHVCKQPRMYQSSITLAVSEQAKDYGWDDLRASDFPSWLPVITQRVAMRLSDDYGEPALLKSYGLGEESDLSAIMAVLRRNQKAVFHAETGTMDLYYQDPDFKLAASVAERFGQEYEMYSRYQERKDAGSPLIMGKHMRAFERLKPKVELQIQRAEAAKRALQSYQEANTPLPTDESPALTQYRRLKQKLEDEQTSLIHLRYEIENFTMDSGGEPSPVAVIKKSGWAPTSHYLIKPIIVNLGWGFLGAITAGILSVLALRMIPSFSRDHSEPSRR